MNAAPDDVNGGGLAHVSARKKVKHGLGLQLSRNLFPLQLLDSSSSSPTRCCRRQSSVWHPFPWRVWLPVCLLFAFAH